MLSQLPHVVNGNHARYLASSEASSERKDNACSHRCLSWFSEPALSFPDVSVPVNESNPEPTENSSRYYSGSE